MVSGPCDPTRRSVAFHAEMIHPDLDLLRCLLPLLNASAGWAGQYEHALRRVLREALDEHAARVLPVDGMQCAEQSTPATRGTDDRRYKQNAVAYSSTRPARVFPVSQNPAQGSGDHEYVRFPGLLEPNGQAIPCHGTSKID